MISNSLFILRVLAIFIGNRRAGNRDDQPNEADDKHRRGGNQ